MRARAARHHPWRGRYTALALCATFGTSRALAETGATPGQELFDQGRALMEQRDYEKACAKFEDSYRVGPGGGTLLNLAVCYELLGRTATAWATFRQALTAAIRDGREDRRRLAEAHLSALAPVLDRLVLRVPDAARVPALVVRRNGVVLGASAWGEALAVDPGEQVVDVSAPGRISARLTAQVHGSGTTVELVVPPLELRSAPPISVPRRTSHEPSFWNAYRIVGTATAGTGLAALVVGAYFGDRAIERDDRANRLCPTSDRCQPAGIVESRRAASDARAAILLVVAGGTAVAAGAVTFFVSPSPAIPGRASMALDDWTLTATGAF